LYSDVITHVNLLAPCGQWLTLRNDRTHLVHTEANVLTAALTILSISVNRNKVLSCFQTRRSNSCVSFSLK